LRVWKKKKKKRGGGETVSESFERRTSFSPSSVAIDSRSFASLRDESSSRRMNSRLSRSFNRSSRTF
jgi:hypothetical protein